MPYVEVPIIGSGTREDPYRANLRVSKSAVIPSNPDGSPKHKTTVVWVNDKYDNEIERGKRRIPTEEAKELIRQIDPKLQPVQRGLRDIHATSKR